MSIDKYFLVTNKPPSQTVCVSDTCSYVMILCLDVYCTYCNIYLLFTIQCLLGSKPEYETDNNSYRYYSNSC